MKMDCTIILTEEEKLIVSTDTTTGITSQGKTNKQALENLQEALELYYEDFPL